MLYINCLLTLQKDSYNLLLTEQILRLVAQNLSGYDYRSYVFVPGESFEAYEDMELPAK